MNMHLADLMDSKTQFENMKAKFKTRYECSLFYKPVLENTDEGQF
jgi:hypothetical protein